MRGNNEPLVDVKEYLPNAIIRLGKERMRVEKTAFLRRTVAQMLKKANSNLPKEYRFVINDAWRPQYIQAAIFYDFIRKGKKRFPGLKGKTLIKEINKYVAPWRGKNISGHMTGGAIDLRLVDKHGRKIPMRVKKLSYKENALSNQEKLPQYIRNNRQIFFSAMEKSGLSNFPKEYWHWSYGDYWWTKRNGKKTTIYGIAKDAKNIYSNRCCPCDSGRRFVECHGK